MKIFPSPQLEDTPPQTKNGLKRRHALLRWFLPVDRVWYSYCEPELIDQRFDERCHSLQTFLEHNRNGKLNGLVENAAQMVLENRARGRYRLVAKLFWRTFTNDLWAIRLGWKWRLERWYLKLRGWDEICIQEKIESDIERT